MTFKTLNGGWPFNHAPNMPFEINEHSQQAKGLAFWLPFTGGRGGYGGGLIDRVDGVKMTAAGTPVWQAGARGWSMLFDDGSNEYLKTSTVPLTTLPLSLSVWVRSDKANSEQCILGLFDSSVSGNWLSIETDSANKVRAWHRFEASISGRVSSANTYTLNKWHHVVGVFNNNSLRSIYFDGLDIASNTSTEGGVVADELGIGARRDSSPSAYLSGNVSNACVYNRALSDAEVLHIYQNPWELYAPVMSPAVYYAPSAPAGRTTYNTDAQTHGIRTGISWRVNA